MAPETEIPAEGDRPASAPETAAPADFKVRVDQLFSQVARRQAREDEAASARMDALRRELVKLKQELGMVRHATERSENNIRDAVDSRISKLAADLSAMAGALERIPSSLAPAAAKIDHAVQRQAAGLTETRAEIAEALELSRQHLTKSFESAMSGAEAVIESAKAELSSVVAASRGEIEARIQAMENRLAADIEVAQEALFEQGGTAAEAAAESAKKMKFAIESGLGAAMSNAVRPFAQEVRALSQRIVLAESRFIESTSKLEKFHRTLMAYMQDRDVTMEETRTRLLVQLLADAGQSLGRRQKAKLANAVANAQLKMAEKATGFVPAAPDTPLQPPEEPALQQHVWPGLQTAGAPQGFSPGSWGANPADVPAAAGPPDPSEKEDMEAPVVVVPQFEAEAIPAEKTKGPRRPLADGVLKSASKPKEKKSGAKASPKSKASSAKRR